MEKDIQVCIVEDDADIRAGISFMVESAAGFQCTALRNAEEVPAHFELSKPDVVLMDINLPGMSGIDCCRYIKTHYPGTLIMMCTVLEDAEKIFEALRAGATGYILKKSAGSVLLESIRDMLNGGAPMSGEIARKVVSFFMENPAAPHKETAEQLTRREQEILDLLSKGYGNKRIATQLYISVHTVRSHIYNIYDKLHVHNKVEALNKLNGRIK